MSQTDHLHESINLRMFHLLCTNTLDKYLLLVTLCMMSYIKYDYIKYVIFKLFKRST